MSACPHHPDVEGTLACVACHNAFCPDCVVKFRGHVMCGPCKNHSVSFEIYSSSFTAPRDAMIWSVVGFFLCGLPAIVGILQGRQALLRIRATPDLPGRPLAVVAMVVGAVGLGLWLLGVALVIFIAILGRSR